MTFITVEGEFGETVINIAHIIYFDESEYNDRQSGIYLIGRNDYLTVDHTPKQIKAKIARALKNNTIE